MDKITDGLVYFVVFLFSTTLHEAAHAWAAFRGGDRTAYHGGQVSLDPLPHIRREPFGMVVLPLISALITGFPLGFASAPFDPNWALKHPKRAALMSLAGPAANILLMLIAAIALRIGYMQEIFFPPERISFGHLAGTNAGGLWSGVAMMLGAFFSVNLLLAAFNLLPLPPLDGSGAVPLFLNDDTSRRYQMFLFTNRALGFLGIFIAWQAFGFVFRPLFTGAVNLLYPGVSYQ